MSRGGGGTISPPISTSRTGDFRFFPIVNLFSLTLLRRPRRLVLWAEEQLESNTLYRKEAWEYEISNKYVDSMYVEFLDMSWRVVDY